MRQERVRLLTFLGAFGMGGTERQAVGLARALNPARFDLHFACFRRWGPLLEAIQALDVPLAEYRIERLYGLRTLQRQMRFARALRRSRIQIVHTYNFYPTVFAVPIARLVGVPAIVVSIRDTGVYLSPAQRRVQRWVCRLADRIVANAEAVREWLLDEGYDPGKISVVRNGIDLSAFSARHRDGRLHAELGAPAGAPIVAVLSRLTPKKGVGDFLEAAALVAPRIPDARFVVVGDNYVVRDEAVVPDVGYRRELEEHARRLGLADRVAFAGLRLDMPDVLAEVAVSVLPSLSEGLSNVLLESMAAGVPIVATRVGGNPEVVQDGRTGLLVPPGDPPALATAIHRILEDDHMASSFREAGRRRVAELFSAERMVRETEGLYLNLLDARRLPAPKERS